MHKYRVLLAACALATITLVGCHDPAGVPNDMHAATTATTYCYPMLDDNATGWVSKSIDGQSPNGWYAETTGNIKRHYHLENSYVHPKSYGFCFFNVPHFSSPGAVPVCTLFYHQASHSGSLNLVFNWLSDIGSTWPPNAESLWKAIDASNDSLALTQAAAGDTWCKLALTTGGGIIDNIGENAPVGGSAPLYTGWKYTNPSNDWYTIVHGKDDVDYSPYIKVVYYPYP